MRHPLHGPAAVAVRFVLATALFVTLGALHEQPSLSRAAATPCPPALPVAAGQAICYAPAEAAQAERQFAAHLSSPLLTVWHLTGLRLSQLLVLPAAAIRQKLAPASGLVYLFGALPAKGGTLLCAARPAAHYLLVAEASDARALVRLRWPCAWQARPTRTLPHLLIAVSANGNRTLVQTLLDRLTATTVPTPAPGTIPTAGTAVSGQATVTTLSPGPARATASPTRYPGTVRTITRADGGQTIHLGIGNRFLLDLDLGSFFATRVQIDSPLMIAQVPEAAVPPGAQGIFTALQPGQATLTVVADPICRGAKPPCEAPSLAFVVYLVVDGAASTPTATATSTPSPTPTLGITRILTFADNGQLISLSAGDRFLLNLGLGGGYKTTIHIDDPAVVFPVDIGPLPPGAQGAFQANAPGQSGLTVTGNPRCYPACLLASFWFHVQLLVH